MLIESSVSLLSHHRHYLTAANKTPQAGLSRESVKGTDVTGALEEKKVALPV